MGIIGGSMLLINLGRLIHDLSKDKDRREGQVVVTKDKGRLRTRYKIHCHNRIPGEADTSSDYADKNQRWETYLTVRVNNPEFFAQKLHQRYASNSKLGEWFSMNKKQLQDLEDIAVLIYAATG